MLKILKPTNEAAAYDIAAAEVAKYCLQITGKEIPIIVEDDGASDLILIGSDAVNEFCRDLFLEQIFEDYKIRYGTDDYQLQSFSHQNRKMLLMAGGTGRSTIYAVYDYFERFCSCRYFWDGEVIPKAEKLPMEDIAVVESPRFEYRGLRYFGHRGLHRFQAEHWGIEDWKHEIDWMMKKKLNLFMLRIGDDDLFQQTFPDIVEYPPKDGKLIEGRYGYTDRTSAWTLQFRGELRKKIMEYANARELMAPTDCGTMTHWYTPTPMDFVEKVNPEVFSQSDQQYLDKETLVWDIRKRHNWGNYIKLSEKSAELYKTDSIFHTIGFAERSYSSDRKKNKNMKFYIYKRIISYLNQRHRDAKLFLASWDFWMLYTDEEVRELLSLFDKEKTVLLDYTSDTARAENFTTWGVEGKFPYIFGIFHAYAPNTEIRGNYALTEERLAIAAKDDACKGLIFWPEVSHTDTFMLEYFTHNSWDPMRLNLEERIKKYCYDRYSENGAEMCAIWKRFFPIIEMMHWSMDASFGQTRELFFYPTVLPLFINEKLDYQKNYPCEKAEKLLSDAVSLLNSISELMVRFQENAFIRRDLFDIVRTIIGRYIHLAMIYVADYCIDKRPDDKEQLFRCEDFSVHMLELLCRVLGEHKDYSIYGSFLKLFEVSEVNSVFEATLKDNAACEYNRTYAYETLKTLSIPEMKYLYEYLNENYRKEKMDDLGNFRENVRQNTKIYENTSLAELYMHEKEDIAALLKEVACELSKFPCRYS